MFQGLGSLRWLSLAHGTNYGISYISHGAFSYLNKLERLYLSHNSLIDVTRDTWEGLQSLYELDIGASQILSLPPKSYF